MEAGKNVLDAPCAMVAPSRVQELAATAAHVAYWKEVLPESVPFWQVRLCERGEQLWPYGTVRVE